jgi:hypothetical protein
MANGLFVSDVLLLFITLLVVEGSIEVVLLDPSLDSGLKELLEEKGVIVGFAAVVGVELTEVEKNEFTTFCDWGVGVV